MFLFCQKIDLEGESRCRRLWVLHQDPFLVRSHRSSREWWLPATPSRPSGELSTEADRCHLVWKVKTPPWCPWPMPGWHRDTNVRPPWLQIGELHWGLSSRALCLGFRPKLDSTWDHILPQRCLASLTSSQVLLRSLNKSPVSKSLPQALLLVNLT